MHWALRSRCHRLSRRICPPRCLRRFRLVAVPRREWRGRERRLGADAGTEWSETKNLKWSVDLPGPGHSCPIVVGDQVIVTCWTGDNPPEIASGTSCASTAQTGELCGDKPVEPVVPDEPFRDMFTENGYASHTPVCDGERIYASSASAASSPSTWTATSSGERVGDGEDPRGWGTASSPMLCTRIW